ncbi:MAG: hypothetical protein JNM68_13050, partial [Dinghuibacter sp.]|nr:hypothetical protein [Dinghuibacter sp.]
MYKLIALCLFVCTGSFLKAQDANVSLDISRRAAADGKNELVFRASIKKGIKLAALRKDSTSLFATLINY